MSVLSLTEYSGTAVVGQPVQGLHIAAPYGAGPAPVAQTPELTYQALAIGGASIASAAFSSRTTLVRLNCDVNCCISFGAAPEAIAAGTSGMTSRLTAGTTEYWGVVPGQKVAVIASA